MKPEAKAKPPAAQDLSETRDDVLVLPSGTVHIRFGDLAHLVAAALWRPHEGPPGNWLRYGATRLALEDELKAAVASKALVVLDPLTLSEHRFPVGEALTGALVSVSALRQWLSQSRGMTVAVGGIGKPDTAEDWTPKPVSRADRDDQLIIAELRRLDFDPLALPPFKPGRSSEAKQAALRSLVGAGKMSEARFKHAWNRLTKSDLVKHRS